MWYSSQTIPVSGSTTYFGNQGNNQGGDDNGHVAVRVRAYARAGADDAALLFTEISPEPVELQYTGSINTEFSAPSSIPVSAKYALVDVFATASSSDHQNFVLAREATGSNTNWVGSGGADPAFDDTVFGTDRVTLTYTGEADGYTPNYGVWYSSQMVPVNSGTIYFGNYGNSGSNGYLYMRFRGFYASTADSAEPLVWTKVAEDYVEHQFSGACPCVCVCLFC